MSLCHAKRFPGGVRSPPLLSTFGDKHSIGLHLSRIHKKEGKNTNELVHTWRRSWSSYNQLHCSRFHIAESGCRSSHFSLPNAELWRELVHEGGTACGPIQPEFKFSLLEEKALSSASAQGQGTARGNVSAQPS